MEQAYNLLEAFLQDKAEKVINYLENTTRKTTERDFKKYVAEAILQPLSGGKCILDESMLGMGIYIVICTFYFVLG
jgi:hypothetical protein